MYLPFYYGIVAYMLDSDIAVTKFKLQSWYYTHFWTNTHGKGMKYSPTPVID